MASTTSIKLKRKTYFLIKQLKPIITKYVYQPTIPHNYFAFSKTLIIFLEDL